MPLISVIIPAYNAERTLLETVDSVQNQTLANIEIIIINDGSTDRTEKTIENLHDSRIKAFSYENGGVSVARNRGITHTMGEFIAFIDADDLWTPDKLERQLAALEAHPEAAVAYSWTQTIDERGHWLHRYHSVFVEGDVYTEILVNNFVSNGSNILVRKEAILSVGEFDSTLKSCEDWDFYIRLAAKYHFVVVPDWQILYRQSSTSLSSQVEVMETDALAVISKAYRSAPAEYQYLQSRSLSWIYEYFTQQYLRRSDGLKSVRVATQAFWKAVRFRPQVLLEGYGQSLMRWLIKRWLLVLMP
jgi:glycosyltransferase involved in cell wall biosynthesis